jgi:NAD(P)-dependent dehydrogenase (short-subunit alcohol dehydrogenase family)
MAFLTGKVAVVTGATKGIGRSVAEALAREGASTVICGREARPAEAAAAAIAAATGAAAAGQACDVRDRRQVAALFALAERTFGGVDIVINNAGVGRFAPTAELSAEDWHLILETNLTGVFHCCQEAIPRMKARGGGYLIQISSLAGKNPFAGGAAYNASKFGLNGFAEAMMLDHRHEGIRVTNICPGSVDTDFSPRSGRAPWKIQPEDIAEIVLDLLRLPDRTLVSYLEVRPSRPPKK